MKLILALDEVSAEFWKKRANLYRKTFEAVKAQRASWWEKAEVKNA